MAEEGPAPSAPGISGWPPVLYWMKAVAGIIVVIFLARTIAVLESVLILIFVSLILAVGLQPAIIWLERRGLSRGWAVALIFLGGFVVVGGFLALVLPIVIREGLALVRKAPEYFSRAQEGSSFIAQLNERFDLDQKIESLGKEFPTTALSLIRSFTTFVFNAVTVLILTLYFATALPKMRHFVARLLRPDRRQDFEEILEESIERVGGYVLGNLAISAIAGAVSFIVLTIIGVPYPVALALWIALTDLIPTIGAYLGGGLAVFVAAFAGTPRLIATIVFVVLYQQIENYIIGPRVMRHAVDMSTAAVMIAILIGATLNGFVGALVALPVAAIVKISFRELYLEERLEQVEAAERSG